MEIEIREILINFFEKIFPSDKKPTYLLFLYVLTNIDIYACKYTQKKWKGNKKKKYNGGYQQK